MVCVTLKVLWRGKLFCNSRIRVKVTIFVVFLKFIINFDDARLCFVLSVYECLGSSLPVPVPP